MYKDKGKAREAAKIRMQKMRAKKSVTPVTPVTPSEKVVTPSVTPDVTPILSRACPPEGKCPRESAAYDKGHSEGYAIGYKNGQNITRLTTHKAVTGELPLSKKAQARGFNK